MVTRIEKIYTNPYTITLWKDEGDSDEQFKEAIDKVLDFIRKCGIVERI
jgi:hypothetical protein